MNIAFRQRYICGRPRRNNTGKELDPETRLYYYGARYLDPKASRWLSGDPAVSEYIPSAPVNEEARKRNGNLPGMGGVFNYVNLHVYHYAGNNPVKLVDPDGKTTIVNNSSHWIIIRGEKRQTHTVRPGETYNTEEHDLKEIDGILMHGGFTYKINNFNRRATLTVSENDEGKYHVEPDAIGNRVNANGDFWKGVYNNCPFLQWLLGWLLGGGKKLSGMRMKGDESSEAGSTWWSSPMGITGLTDKDVKVDSATEWDRKLEGFRKKYPAGYND